MKIEKIDKIKTIIADEGKCFKNENIKTITSYIVLSKFDSEKNYEEVNIEDYELELQREKALEQLNNEDNELQIESTILESGMLNEDTSISTQPTQNFQNDQDRLHDIISHAVEEALRLNL